MAGNTAPQFPLNGNFGTPCRVTAANTSSSGSGTVGTDMFLALTAGANGTLVEKIIATPTATAPTTTTATVARVYLSTVGAGATTNADTHLVKEIALPASAADNAATAVNEIEIPLNIRIPAGSFLLVSNHAAPAANSAWKFTPIAGDY